MKKLDPLDDALTLMYYGWLGMTRGADDYLATIGLGRVHHRILYAVARRDSITITDLLAILRISKQALHRPMKQLLDQALVTTTRDPARHRYKVLTLTEAGRVVENEASSRERQVMGAAFEQVGPKGREAWAAVMAAIGGLDR